MDNSVSLKPARMSKRNSRAMARLGDGFAPDGIHDGNLDQLNVFDNEAAMQPEIFELPEVSHGGIQTPFSPIVHRKMKSGSIQPPAIAQWCRQFFVGFRMADDAHGAFARISPTVSVTGRQFTLPSSISRERRSMTSFHCVSASASTVSSRLVMSWRARYARSDAARPALQRLFQRLRSCGYNIALSSGRASRRYRRWQRERYQRANGLVAAKTFPLPAQIICATYRPESAADGNPPPATTQWPAM